MNKKAVFVTLADRKYLEYAKQVFAGAYFNAGWKGDYLLLAHNIPEKDLKWFRKKGILIYHCKPVFKERIAGTNPVIVSKFYLFTEYFKRWDHVIYYDADVIVRASLDRLLELDGFASVADCDNAKVKEGLKNLGVNHKQSSLINMLEKNYKLSSLSFGSGNMAFHTNIIKTNTFNDLKNISMIFEKVINNADQVPLNLLFCQKWLRLPPIYDFYVMNGLNQWCVPEKMIDGIAIHFPGDIKPWSKRSNFYKEWKNNYSQSGMIDLSCIPKGNIWSKKKITRYSRYLKYRDSFIFKLITKRGIKDYYFSLMFFVERKFPYFFSHLKNTKKIFKEYLKNV